MAIVEAPPREQSRARYPDHEGYVERDGVRVFWERYGDGHPTVVFLPTWSILHSRMWKLQIPYFARHFRVVTFDGRGNGKSDRPDESAAYADHEFVADALAVMDASETRRAVVVAVSMGCRWLLRLAADHGDRVAGLVAIGASLPLTPPLPERDVHAFDDPLDTDEGWAKENRYYWLRDYRGYLEFFFGRCFTEPHSTKQIEDCVGWGLQTTPQTLLVIEEAPTLATTEDVLDLCSRVGCPVLVVHGDEDAVTPYERGVALADAARGRLVTFVGSGHLPHARDPVRFNLVLRDFVESISGRA